MTDLSAVNNDYAQRLYRASTLSETEQAQALQSTSKQPLKEATSRVALGAAPGLSASDAAEKFELGALPQQKPLVLKDASLYKDMLGKLPSKLNFDMSEVMATIFKSMMSMMRSQSAARMADLNMAGEADKQAAQQMKTAAAVELGGAVLGASMQLVGAGMTMAGTAYSAKADDTMEFNQMMKPFNAGSEMISSVGSMGKSALEYTGKLKSADAELSKSASTRSQAIREYDDEMFREAQKFVDQMLQIIQSISNQQHAASSQILSA